MNGTYHENLVNCSTYRQGLTLLQILSFVLLIKWAMGYSTVHFPQVHWFDWLSKDICVQVSVQGTNSITFVLYSVLTGIE